MQFTLGFKVDTFPHAVRTTYCKIRTESYGAFLKASRVAFINENVPKENLMKPKKTLLMLALLASTATTGTAQASLFDRGNGLIYNDVTNTTWVSDANLFATQAAGNANLVTDIIAANHGVIYDLPNVYDTVANSGIYTLTNADFGTDSVRMDWWAAQAWIGYLNKTSYAGYNNWALPATPAATVTADFNQTGSQMGELYYNELGGEARKSISTTHNANYNLFTNIQSYEYWSSTELLELSYTARVFHFSSGLQYIENKQNHVYAWAVRTGDVAAVPIPAAFWLFGSGLVCLLGLRRDTEQQNNLPSTKKSVIPAGRAKRGLAGIQLPWMAITKHTID